MATNSDTYNVNGQTAGNYSVNGAGADVNVYNNDATTASSANSASQTSNNGFTNEMYLQSNGSYQDMNSILETAKKQYDPTYGQSDDRYGSFGIQGQLAADKGLLAGDQTDATMKYQFAAKQAGVSDNQINQNIQNADSLSTQNARFDNLSQNSYGMDQRNDWMHAQNQQQYTGYGKMTQSQHQEVADRDLQHLYDVQLSGKNAFKYDATQAGQSQDQINQQLNQQSNTISQNLSQGTSNANKMNGQANSAGSNVNNSNASQDHHKAKTSDKSEKTSHHTLEKAALAGAGIAVAHHVHKKHAAQKGVKNNTRGRSMGPTLHKVIKDSKTMQKTSEKMLHKTAHKGKEVSAPQL